MAHHTPKANNNRPDRSAVLLYAVAFSLLAIYLLTSLAARSSSPIPPLLRIVILLISCLAAYLAARLPREGDTPEGRTRRVRAVMWYCFALYLHLLLTFTLFDVGMGRNIFRALTATAEDRAYYMKWFVNLSPLHTIRTIYIDGFRNGYITESYLLLNLAGNLCVFAPFAFFLPYFARPLNRFWLFLPTMLATVIAVELCQLALMCGSCDIDDVILNMSGAVLTYLLLHTAPGRRLQELATRC